MKRELVSAPGEEPVTLEEVKAHGRISTSDDDTVIEGLILAARQWVEEYTRSYLVTQTIDIFLDKFEFNLLLPYGPIQSISSIRYYDTDQALQTVTSTDYEVDIKRNGAARVRPISSWPAAYDQYNAVEIRAIVGYGGCEDVPQPIKLAMFLLINGWYENREAGCPVQLHKIPFGVAEMLAAYRLNWF